MILIFPRYLQQISPDFGTTRNFMKISWGGRHFNLAQFLNLIFVGFFNYYFPIQKSLKIEPNISSVFTAPVISPIAWVATRNSSAAKTTSCSFSRGKKKIDKLQVYNTLHFTICRKKQVIICCGLIGKS